MWRKRQRKERIDRVAENERQIGEMRRSLDAMLDFFAAEGATVESAAADSVEGVPPGLIAACRTSAPRRGGEPVKVTTREGRQVIALVSPGGDPAEIWDAIHAVTAR